MTEKPEVDEAEALIEAASLPEKNVTLVLKGSLVAEYEELEQQLELASREARSLGERSEASAIAERMEELRQEMLKHRKAFVVRALPPLDWANLQAQIPTPEDLKKMSPEERGAEIFKWDCISIHRCLVSPKLSEDQVMRLFQRLSVAQRLKVGRAVNLINMGEVDVPFSYAASALLQPSEET